MIFVSDRSSPTHKNDETTNASGVIGQPATVSPSAGNDHTRRVQYRVSINNKELKRLWASLIDRGANGSIAGKDTTIVNYLQDTIDLSGIDNHTVRSLPLVTAGGYVVTQRGPIIVIINQAAYMHDGRTILSSGQLEAFKCAVNDKSKKFTGEIPYIETIEGYKIPMTMRRGLPYIKMRPFTQSEWEDKSIPHVHITSPETWDPSVLDSIVEDNWYKQDTATEFFVESTLDETGNLKGDDDDVESEDGNNHQAID